MPKIISYDQLELNEIEVSPQDVIQMRIVNFRTYRARDGSFKKFVKRWHILIHGKLIRTSEFHFRVMLEAIKEAGIKLKDEREPLVEWKHTQRFGLSERKACDHTYSPVK